MNVWLVTWRGVGDHGKTDDPLAAIFSSRLADDTIRELVERLYALSSLTASELTGELRQGAMPVYPADLNQGIVTCGANPHLFARKVTDFRVVHIDDGHEELSWREPDRYGFGEDGRPALQNEGRQDRLQRKRVPPWA